MFDLVYPAPIVAFILVFIGSVLRTFYPYIQKYRTLPPKDTPKIVWDHRYTLTLGSNLFLTFIGVILLFNTWSPPDGTLFQVAITSFFTGWGSQDTINRLVS